MLSGDGCGGESMEGSTEQSPGTIGGAGGNDSKSGSELPDLTPSFVRPQPVIRLRLARDERPAVSADGEQPIILDSYNDSGRIMFELFSNGEIESKSLQELLSAASVTHRALTPDFVPDADAEVLHWVAPEIRDKALRAQAHLIDVISGRPAGDTDEDAALYDAEKTDIADRRKAKCAELGWSPSTMSRREAAYRERGIVGLIPHSGRKSQLKNVIDVAPEILAVIREHAQAGYLGSKSTCSPTMRPSSSISDAEGWCREPQELADRTVGISRASTRCCPTTALLRCGINSTVAGASASPRPDTSNPRGRRKDRCVIERMTSARCWRWTQRPPTSLYKGLDGEPRRAYAVFAVCVSTKMTWLRLVQEPPRGRDLALLLFDVIGGHSASARGTGSPDQHRALAPAAERVPPKRRSATRGAPYQHSPRPRR